MLLSLLWLVGLATADTLLYEGPIEDISPGGFFVLADGSTEGAYRLAALRNQSSHGFVSFVAYNPTEPVDWELAPDNANSTRTYSNTLSEFRHSITAPNVTLRMLEQGTSNVLAELAYSNIQSGDQYVLVYFGGALREFKADEAVLATATIPYTLINLVNNTRAYLQLRQDPSTKIDFLQRHTYDLLSADDPVVLLSESFPFDLMASVTVDFQDGPNAFVLFENNSAATGVSITWLTVAVEEDVEVMFLFNAVSLPNVVFRPWYQVDGGGESKLIVEDEGGLPYGSSLGVSLPKHAGGESVTLEVRALDAFGGTIDSINTAQCQTTRFGVIFYQTETTLKLACKPVVAHGYTGESFMWLFDAVNKPHTGHVQIEQSWSRFFDTGDMVYVPVTNGVHQALIYNGTDETYAPPTPALMPTGAPTVYVPSPGAITAPPTPAGQLTSRTAFEVSEGLNLHFVYPCTQYKGVANCPMGWDLAAVNAQPSDAPSTKVTMVLYNALDAVVVDWQFRVGGVWEKLPYNKPLGIRTSLPLVAGSPADVLIRAVRHDDNTTVLGKPSAILSGGPNGTALDYEMVVVALVGRGTTFPYKIVQWPLRPPDGTPPNQPAAYMALCVWAPNIAGITFNVKGGQDSLTMGYGQCTATWATATTSSELVLYSSNEDSVIVMPETFEELPSDVEPDLTEAPTSAPSVPVASSAVADQTFHAAFAMVLLAAITLR